MGQDNPNGTYKGTVNDAIVKNDATLTITSSDPQTGTISKASMDYSGLKFEVDGSFIYENVMDESALSLTLRAQAGEPANVVLSITMRSLDRNYSELEGTVRVEAGGPGAGTAYNIALKKS